MLKLKLLFSLFTFCLFSMGIAQAQTASTATNSAISYLLVIHAKDSTLVKTDATHYTLTMSTS